MYMYTDYTEGSSVDPELRLDVAMQGKKARQKVDSEDTVDREGSVDTLCRLLYNDQTHGGDL